MDDSFYLIPFKLENNKQAYIRVALLRNTLPNAILVKIVDDSNWDSNLDYLDEETLRLLGYYTANWSLIKRKAFSEIYLNPKIMQLSEDANLASNINLFKKALYMYNIAYLFKAYLSLHINEYVDINNVLLYFVAPALYEEEDTLRADINLLFKYASDSKNAMEKKKASDYALNNLRDLSIVLSSEGIEQRVYYLSLFYEALAMIKDRDERSLRKYVEYFMKFFS